MKKYTVQVRIVGKLYKRTVESRNEREAAEMVKSDIIKKIIIESVTEKEPPKPKPPHESEEVRLMMSMFGIR
jgi:hypothetical protein